MSNSLDAEQECTRKELVMNSFSQVNLPADYYSYLFHGIEEDLNFVWLPYKRCLKKVKNLSSGFHSLFLFYYINIDWHRLCQVKPGIQPI